MEAKAAICKMKRGKAAGPDEITLEMALALEEEGIIWLYRVMDAIWKEKKLEVVQMRCLLTMRGVTRRERMRNEVIRQELKMAELREKIRKCIRNTRWYGHVKRMEENEFVSWSAERREPGTRKRGRPRKRWMGCVRDDGRVVDLDKVDYRIEWRKVSRRPPP